MLVADGCIWGDKRADLQAGMKGNKLYTQKNKSQLEEETASQFQTEKDIVQETFES